MRLHITLQALQPNSYSSKSYRKKHLHLGTKADVMKNTAQSVYATQIGAFLPYLVSVNAVITLVGTETSDMAEKLMYLFPDMLVELIMVPFKTKVEQVKQAAMRTTRMMMVRERRSDSKLSPLVGTGWPSWNRQRAMLM